MERDQIKRDLSLSGGVSYGESTLHCAGFRCGHELQRSYGMYAQLLLNEIIAFCIVRNGFVLQNAVTDPATP